MGEEDCSTCKFVTLWFPKQQLGQRDISNPQQRGKEVGISNKTTNRMFAENMGASNGVPHEAVQHHPSLDRTAILCMRYQANMYIYGIK